MFPTAMTRERQSLTEAQGRVRALGQAAHEFQQRNDENDHARAEVNSFEAANPGLAQSEHSQATTSWLFAGVVFAAYAIDVMLAAPVLDEAAANDVLRAALKIVMPAVLVTVEVGITIKRYLARVHGLRSDARAFTALGFILATVMPLLVASTQLATWQADGGGTSTTDGLMVVFRVAALTFLSLGVHLFLLLNGQHVYEAKVHLFTHRHWNRLQRRVARAGAASENARINTVYAYGDYDAAFNLHNRQFSPITPGPFDETTIRVLESLFRRGNDGAGGPTRAPAPATPPAPMTPASHQAPPAAQPPVPPTNGSAPAASPPEPDGDYYRRIVERQIRDADGEVRP